MTIANELQRQEWQLTETEKWISVKDGRPEFRKAFSTDRVGKIIGSKFYVTLPLFGDSAHKLILSLGQCVEHVDSTSGRGIQYPGLETAQIAPAALNTFAEQLRQEIDNQMQQKLVDKS